MVAARTARRAELVQASRIVIAATASWGLCVALGAEQPPVFAAVVPVLALRDAPFSALNVSVKRLAGVVAGILLGVGLLSLLPPSTLSVAIVLSCALLVGPLLRLDPAVSQQVVVSALLVFAPPNPAPTPSPASGRPRSVPRSPSSAPSCSTRPTPRG